ncbi:MAP7 domain-containing protein [Pedobacter sp. SL55]|uniref:MAP7 domain-containing protein n=1 Tax=Pedobacter sp. SL55 TaxID=2995161 RepID=UPI00227018D5|nr:MAP7 domain-containing protein [Pedobacter sp. SL55]WAC40046.1 MAP7 domain-containing protein [Pedobacter sp. SL55]
MKKIIYLCLILFISYNVNAQQTYLLNSTYSGVSAKMLVNDADPASYQKYNLVVKNHTQSKLKITITYRVVDKCSGYKSGTKSFTLSAGQETADGGFTGSIYTKDCVKSGNSVSNAYLVEMKVENISEKEREEREKIERERLEKERLAKEKIQQEKERIEKQRLEKENLEKERQEQERLDAERLEKERIESEKKALDEKLKNEQDAQKRQALEEEKKLAEVEKNLLEKPVEVKKEVKKVKTKEEEDREYKAYLYCVGQYNIVEQLVVKARSKRTNQGWEDAKRAYENYTCYNKVPLNYAWKTEIDNGLAATAISEAVVSTISTLTSTPWTYGYGQFIDAKNSTYYHRFQLGTSDSYDEKAFSLDLSIMSNIMRLPTRTLNYSFEADNGSKWDVTKSANFDNINVFSISVGPSLTLWPQKNIYLQLTPEANMGFNFSDTAPVMPFTAFPSVQGKVGFRFGIVYLSGSVGALFKSFKVDKQANAASEKGAIQGYNVGTVEGKWIAQDFDSSKMVQHRYWMLSLGLDL